MVPFKTLQPGMEYEVSYLVEVNHTASHVGSGALSVLSTPSMIGFMERSSHQMLAKYLADGFSSVGVRVDVSHLAPTPVGASIRVRAEILQVNGSQVTFRVEAWDGVEKIGEGQHLRVIIDQQRFLKRVANKASALGFA